jgi:hypothetical protein
MEQLFHAMFVMALIFCGMVLIANYLDNSSNAAQVKYRVRTERIRELQEETNLTGNFYYNKVPGGTELIVEKKKEEKTIWVKATEEDKIILKAKKLL